MGAPRAPNGPKSWMDSFNALADYVESITPIGPLVSDSPSGKGRYIAGGNSVASSSKTIFEFALYDASGSHLDAGGLWVGVKPGITACYALASGVDPWPGDFDSGSDYKYEFTVTDDGIVWIHFHNDTSGDLNMVDTIEMGNGASIPDSSGDDYYLPVGTWQVADSALTILTGRSGIGNQEYNYYAYLNNVGPL